VVAVPLQPGHANALVETLWRNLPASKDKEVARPDVRIDAAALLPANLAYYAYSGSLTTPPCSEGVRWMVLKSPSPVSAREIAVFAARYPLNARPAQPRNGREILSSE
jgi:carbonic anhydrase